MEGWIVVLVNDTAGPGAVAEHGLAIWMAVDGRHILLDTGQGSALSINAHALDVDLSRTDTLVLSHGHYDHTGGVAELLRRAPDVHVFCHSAVRQKRYALFKSGPKSIEMPADGVLAINALPDHRVHWLTEGAIFGEGIGSTGPIERRTAYEDTGGPFFLDAQGLEPDLIEDDQAMWMTTQRGLIVCVGCSHAGIINTLNQAMAQSGQRRIRTVIGGFHLLNADDERLDRTIAAFRDLSPECLMPCHCTGEKAVDALSAALGDRVRPCRAGMIHWI
jgi:7,8-dihydropterin-6-yl-methyl-4-(beta-D-ribofuranosyl)aminobenzene 5'-phosphate synthase